MSKFGLPLVRDAFAISGSSKCECLSVLDFKNAYYAIKLSESPKSYCGILPNFGSTSYVYQRMSSGYIQAHLCDILA